jgi:hypothetical protein
MILLGAGGILLRGERGVCCVHKGRKIIVEKFVYKGVSSPISLERNRSDGDQYNFWTFYPVEISRPKKQNKNNAI